MTTIGRPSSIQAAAIPLRKRDLRSPTRGRRLLQDTGDDLYWSFYKAVPAISNYVQVLSNSADLVSYYPGLIDPDSSEPVPVEDGPVMEVWNEIGGEAAMSDWVSSLVVHLSVPGQGWFVPLVKPDVLASPTEDSMPSLNGDAPNEGKVFWQVVSTADLRRLLKLDAGQAIPEDDNRIWRIYDPDPQNSKDPTSSVRRVATQAELLILIDRRTAADLRSRIHAGVLFLPSSLKSLITPDGRSWADILEDGLISAAQPGDLASLVPLIAYLEREETEQAKMMRLSVDDGDWLVKLETKTLQNLAVGLDAPQELTTGMNTLNHWGAWLIQEETYTQHLDPLLVRILRSLNPWWQAQLSARRIPNVENQVLWRNPATAINRPNAFNEAKDLHAAFVISDAELRAAGDKGDDAKPDEAEIERRIRIQQALNSGPREPTADETRNVPETSPLQAATNESRPLALARLARRLANIDQTALLRLETEAARQLRRRRQSLLARIEAAASRRAITAAADDIETLPMRLGPSVVQELIPGNLADPDDFEEAPFVSIFASAQAEATAALATALIDRDTDGDANDRSAAGSLLTQALAAAVVTSLFRRPETRGEVGIDGAELVPTDDVRRAMDTAGGGLAQRDGLDAWEGIGNGRRTTEALTRGGIETTSFTWVYGIMPRKTFEPHRDLDNKTFDSWTDPLLSQSFEADWLSGEFYFPQDHRGCRCSYVRTLDEGASDQSLQQTNQDRLDAVQTNPRAGIDDNPAIVAAARDRFLHAMRRESDISRLLNPIARDTNATFQHYGERIKFESSIRDKIWREIQADPSLTPQQAALNVTDTNRYTLMWEPDDLYQSNHARTVQAFNDAGWETIADRNAWAPGDAYDGMNYKFANGDDIVEVQFHTPTSAAIKDESHLLYSRARIMAPGPEKDSLLQQVLDLWNTDRSHVPPGMENVGTQTWYDI